MGGGDIFNSHDECIHENLTDSCNKSFTNLFKNLTFLQVYEIFKTAQVSVRVIVGLYNG